MAMTKNTLSKELKNQINRALKALNLEDDISPKELQKAFWKKFNKSASKPKRLPSGYNLFCKANRVNHSEDGKSPQDVMRSLATAWKTASKDEKDKYNNEAKAAKLEFVESSPSKPKKTSRTPSGYNLFCKDRRAEHTEDGKSPQDVMRALGAAWKSSSDEIRDEYNEKAKQMKPKTDSLSSLTLKELKTKCKEKNLKISGKKADLIDRLENPSKHTKKRLVPKDSDSESDLESD
jgi:hypothetical protein